MTPDMTPAYNAVQRLNVTERFIDYALGPDTLKAAARLLQEVAGTWDHYAWLARLDGRDEVSEAHTYSVEFLHDLAVAFVAAAEHTAHIDLLMRGPQDSTVVLVAVPMEEAAK